MLLKGFYHSVENHHILKSIQEAYGLKALNLVKAAFAIGFPMGQHAGAI